MNRIWKSSILTSSMESNALISHYKSAGGLVSSFAEVKLRGKSETDARASKKGRREIYTAVMQLLNYIIYDYKNNARERDYLLYDFKYPMIVFDGRMFVAELKKGEIEVEECQHVVLEQEYVDRELWGHESRTFYIDVVDKRALPTLADSMLADVFAFSKLFVEGMDSRRQKLGLISTTRKRKTKRFPLH